MALPTFDPTNAIRFDLSRGQVSFDDSYRVLVPVEAMLRLCATAGDEAALDFGRQIGADLGRRVAARLADQAATASVQDVVDHLGGELALVGFGCLSVERWGRALVLAVDDSPSASDGDALLAAVLEGAVQRAMSRDVRVVVLAREDRTVRLLCSSVDTAPRVRELLAGGTSWGDVLTKLHRPASSPSEST